MVKDLIENYYVLFRVDSISREKEKKMQDALENFHLGSTKRKCSGDMKMWIYIWEKDETTAINITVTYPRQGFFPNFSTPVSIHLTRSIEWIELSSGVPLIAIFRISRVTE